jgi:hypothetical protein
LVCHVDLTLGFLVLQRFYRLDLKCVACPNMAWIFIVLFIVGLMALMLIGVWLNSRRINLAALGIGVDFAQAVAMFITFSFLWPPELKTVFTSISLFSFNIQIIAPEVCYPLCFRSAGWLFMFLDFFPLSARSSGRTQQNS